GRFLGEQAQGAMSAFEAQHLQENIQGVIGLER
ncbi:hypothetical protein SAMN05421831_11547, partial [Allopseudospirillum japonicum]